MNTDVEHFPTGHLYRPPHGKFEILLGQITKMWEIRGWGCQESPTLYEHSGTTVVSTNTIIQICQILVYSLSVLS